ncbi:MAG: O-antigen ligase family protein [Planctomycetaceae bacterium]
MDTNVSNPVHAYSVRRSPGIMIRVVDVGIMALLFLVPFVMGGRQALGQLLLVAGSCVVALAWVIHQWQSNERRWIGSPGQILLVCGVALVVVQQIAMPTTWIQIISPEIFRLLPTWAPGADNALGNWSFLSLTPVETRDGLAILLAYVLVFLVVSQRITRVEHVHSLLKCVAVVAVAMAVFGLFQFLTSNGKFFWFHDNPFRDTWDRPKGSFWNQNHFVGFLSLGVGPILFWIEGIYRKGTRDRSTKNRPARSLSRLPSRSGVVVLCGALALMSYVALLAQSRGGLLAMLTALLVSVPILWWTSRDKTKMVYGLAAAGLLFGGMLVVFGDQVAMGRLDSVFSGELEQADDDHGRRAIWGAVASAIRQFPVIGTGVGSHPEVYPIYLDATDTGQEFTHAESGYLQVALETGGLGLVLAVSGLLLCVVYCVRGILLSDSPSLVGPLGAVLASIAASTAHSLVDFVWYIPGCMIVLVVLMACGVRLWQLAWESQGRSVRSFQLPRGVCLAGGVGVAALSFWMISTKTPPVLAESHWYDYLRLSFLSPDDDASQQTREDVVHGKLQALNQTVSANPLHARGHLRLARVHLSLFEIQQKSSDNAMSLSQIRAAAEASEFQSGEQLRSWLERAVGDNLKHLDRALVHSRRALELCPLQGHGYVYLAQLDFLKNSQRAVKWEHLDQAIKLRPFDAHVRFVVGRQYLSEGDMQQAMQHWRSCFHRHSGYQKLISQVLAANLPASLVVEQMQPDVQALRFLGTRYSPKTQPDDYLYLQRAFAVASVKQAGRMTGDQAIAHLISAHHTFAHIGDSGRAWKCLSAAQRMESHSYDVRYALGRWFFSQNKFDEAAEHFAWCARQKPNDKSVQAWAEDAVEKRLRNTGTQFTRDTDRASRRL